MDILKDFQGFRDQRTDLNKILHDFSNKLPGKSCLSQKNEDHLEGDQDPLTVPETNHQIQDTAPTLMTDGSDTCHSFSKIKLIENKSLKNLLMKTHLISPLQNNSKTWQTSSQMK